MGVCYYLALQEKGNFDISKIKIFYLGKINYTDYERMFIVDRWYDKEYPNFVGEVFDSGDCYEKLFYRIQNMKTFNAEEVSERIEQEVGLSNTYITWKQIGTLVSNAQSILGIKETYNIEDNVEWGVFSEYNMPNREKQEDNSQCQ